MLPIVLKTKPKVLFQLQEVLANVAIWIENEDVGIEKGFIL